MLRKQIIFSYIFSIPVRMNFNIRLILSWTQAIKGDGKGDYIITVKIAQKDIILGTAPPLSVFQFTVYWRKNYFSFFHKRS